LTRSEIRTNRMYRGCISPAERCTTVAVALEAYWNVLQLAKGRTELEPDEPRQADEVLLQR
jgi:hypothetical protein